MEDTSREDLVSRCSHEHKDFPVTGEDLMRRDFRAFFLRPGIRHPVDVDVPLDTKTVLGELDVYVILELATYALQPLLDIGDHQVT